MKRNSILSVGLFIFLVLTVLFTYCKSNNTKDTGNDSREGEINIAAELPKTLVIEAKNVSVYMNTNEVDKLCTLKTGTICKVLQKGSFAVIEGMQDFWYLIESNDQKGWVFGAYTSLRQNSEFEVFLREFKKEKKDTLSREFAINFLNGKAGFKPLNYKRLDGNHYAALFYNEMFYPSVELLLVIYKSGKLMNEYSLFKENISGCYAPQAIFTNSNFIKFLGPSCKDDVPPVQYFQILEDYSIKEIKSTIIVKSTEDLIPAINIELKAINASLSTDCNCKVHSSVKQTFTDKKFIFYTITKNQCDNFCNTSNSSLIAMPDSNLWVIKYDEPGGFKAIYESGIKDKYIVVLEELKQYHIVEKKLKEKMYLLDPVNQTLKELNLNSESCIILSPDQYSCDYCKKHTTHTEELIIKGNPVKQVIKKISNFYYDDTDCIQISQDSKTLIYNWIPEKLMFVVAD